MRAYTTDTFTISLENGDLDNYKDIVVTIQKGGYALNKGLDELTVSEYYNRVVFTLSQEETSHLKGQFQVQINILYENGERRASGIYTVRNPDSLNLYRVVMV